MPSKPKKAPPSSSPSTTTTSAPQNPPPKKKSHLDDPPPQAFLDALQDYYTAQDALNALKPTLWPALPSEPPNSLPPTDPAKVPIPWYDAEIESQEAAFFGIAISKEDGSPIYDDKGEPVMEDEQGEGNGDLAARMAELDLEAEEAVAKVREEARRKKQVEREEREKKGWLEIDEDKIVRKLMGREGLIVPAGVYRPEEKKKPWDES